MQLKRIKTDAYATSTELRNMKAAIEFCLTHNFNECTVNRMRFRILENHDNIVRIVRLKFEKWIGVNPGARWGYEVFNGKDCSQSFYIK